MRQRKIWHVSSELMLKINRNKERMGSEMHRKKIIGSFLIIGTLLALYLTINVGYDIFWKHPVWMHRDGLIRKFGFVAIYADLPLLFIAGLTSTISFFRKGHIWKPITKGIIINITLWLILAGMMIGIVPTNLTFKICSLLVIALAIWMMSQTLKMIRL